jgi:hypothetical protein
MYDTSTIGSPIKKTFGEMIKCAQIFLGADNDKFLRSMMLIMPLYNGKSSRTNKV